MFAIRSLLFGVGLFVWPTLLLAQTPSDVISKAIEQLGSLPANDEEIAHAAATSLAAMNPKEVVEAFFLAMKRPQQVTNQRRTLNVLVGSIKNFDIESWLDRLEAEPDPMMLNYGVRIADLSTKSDSPRLKTFKLRLLSDKRIAQELHGEARAYASKGMRLCDIVMNSLWSKEPESDRPPGYPVDAGTSRQQRDEMIAAYANKFNVPIDADVAVPPEPKLNQVPTPEAAPQKALESKPTATQTSEELTSSTPWSIIVVLIVAAIGLLWLLLKGRK
jgi:hypothetical protein